MRTRLLTCITAVLLAAALGGGAPSALAQDTSAVAVNTRDDSEVYRSAFHVTRTMQAVVDSSNAAVAFASCESCRTVAVSIQVVLAMSDVEELSTENLALAIKELCEDCDTAAFAYQFVRGLGEVVHFTADGNRALAELRQRMLALRKGSLPDAELQAELDAISGELERVLATELVVAGEPSAAPSAPTPDQQPAQTETATPAPTETGTTTPTRPRPRARSRRRPRARTRQRAPAPSRQRAPARSRQRAPARR